ncbi:hypothetical protein E0485_12320 [Paenibacillus albiflavus]|uniref:Uncharacterized protein n=1 Tax=Paenibacillus albiflavus TaxID=2545760 RepID=A0A4R4EGG6_9BACL|nr:hypothetical protein [Paenibacillus albiflavus]TCZ77235.1 hypothetical protein E0485_12320 [Paenibacillus albiflavus]
MWMLTAILILITLVLFALFLWTSYKHQGGKKPAAIIDELLSKEEAKKKLMQLYQRSYNWSMKVPFLQRYVRNIRKRLESIHTYDGYTLRKEAMKITFATLGSALILILLIMIINPNLMLFFWVLLGLIVINGMMIDAFVNRLEDRLIKQFIQCLSHVRHYYQQHKMVDEAIYEAAQVSSYEAALHAERVHQMLTSYNPKAKLDEYYEVAPNRYLKMFAGISFFIMEYGDKTVKNGSLYLNALSKLTQEMNFDILRREKLGHLLKGLTVIALLPVLFTSPIENWARTYFPAISDFYAGQFGLLFKIVVFLTIIVSYILLRKMLENDEANYSIKPARNQWRKRLYDIPPIKWIVNRFVPGKHTKQHFQISTLLKETNSPLTIEWFYMNRLLLTFVSFIGVMVLFFYMHSLTVDRILHAPTKQVNYIGKLPPEEQLKAEQLTEFDRSIIQDLSQSSIVVKERIIQKVSEATQTDRNSASVILTANRIFGKINILKDEYLKWWELVIGLGISIMIYYVPVWILRFQKRLREIDMQNEVDQFHTLIGILSAFERVSVEIVLEWLDRSAMIFRAPLQTCLLHYDYGAERALEQLKQEVVFVPFVRIVERLQLAVEKISLQAAFDDLEMEQEFYKQKREQHYEKVIEQKSSWGKLIGFAPMYALIFMYLVIPLLYISSVQMTQYVKVLQQ